MSEEYTWVGNYKAEGKYTFEKGPFHPRQNVRKVSYPPFNRPPLRKHSFDPTKFFIHRESMCLQSKYPQLFVWLCKLYPWIGNRVLSLFISAQPHCVTRAPVLNFIRSWVALSFKVVSQSVRHAWHPSRSPLYAIYKGTNALYWPSVLYWPSTQLHHLVTHSWANWI